MDSSSRKYAAELSFQDQHNDLCRNNHAYCFYNISIIHDPKLVASPRIELGSGASETLILSIVLRGRFRVKKLISR